MNCGYPSQAFKQVRDKIDNTLPKEERNKRKNEGRGDHVQTKSVVIIPYVKGVSDALQRTFRRHGVAASMQPHQTLS